MSFTIQDPARNDAVAVGTSSVRIFDPRTQMQPRKAFSIRNISTNAADLIYLAFGLEQAVVGEGVKLRVNDAWNEWSDVGNPCWQGSITAVCATANGNLSITER